MVTFICITFLKLHKQNVVESTQVLGISFYNLVCCVSERMTSVFSQLACTKFSVSYECVLLGWLKLAYEVLQSCLNFRRS